MCTKRGILCMRVSNYKSSNIKHQTLLSEQTSKRRPQQIPQPPERHSAAQRSMESVVKKGHQTQIVPSCFLAAQKRGCQRRSRNGSQNAVDGLGICMCTHVHSPPFPASRLMILLFLATLSHSLAMLSSPMMSRISTWDSMFLPSQLRSSTATSESTP